MEKYSGKTIFQGIAIGKIKFYQNEEKTVKRCRIEDTTEEVNRYETAKETAIAQLNELYQKACKEVGEVNAAVFEVHAMMLEDADYNDSVKNIIEQQNVNAEYAVAITGDNFSKMFAEMDDEYFKARSADILDISDRVVAVLSGNTKEKYNFDEPVILVSDDLAPSETVQMDKSKLLAFVTRYGSSNSHTAILARTMMIPALIGIEIKEEWDGKNAIVDGINGILYIEPEADILQEMQEKQQKMLQERKLLAELKGKEDVTKSGKKIKLFANIGSVSDVTDVLKNDAAGIGLFRSEFLYLQQDHLPTEEEQFQLYKTVAENMAGRKVIIRTLDIGRLSAFSERRESGNGLSRNSNLFNADRHF